MFSLGVIGRVKGGVFVMWVVFVVRCLVVLGLCLRSSCSEGSFVRLRVFII